MKPMGGDGQDFVIGYMDLVDFECELGCAMGGNKVYPSITDLKESKKCVEGCGIVKVKVEFIEIVDEGTLV